MIKSLPGDTEIASKSNTLGNILWLLGRRRKFIAELRLMIKSLPGDMENP
jgi:hypothetical protein